MILPESRNLEWIEKAAKDNNASNPILVEKVIREHFNIIRIDNILNVIKGRQKSAYGFSWRYKTNS